MARRSHLRGEIAAAAFALGTLFAACIPGFASRRDIVGNGGAGGSMTSSSSGATHTASSSSASSSGTGGTGGAATCTDGIRNQGEADVDCGGPCTAKCALGKRCVADQDCAFASGTPVDGGTGPAARCVASVCVPPPKAAWTSFSPIGPLYREETVLTYDSLNQLGVLYGGRNGTGSGAQAWGWNGTTWTGLGNVPATASTRLAPALAYDAARGRTMLFGGTLHGAQDTYLNDAYEWDGQVWTSIAQTASWPSPRGSPAFAFDVNGRMVLFGGFDGSSALDETWLWNTGAGTFTEVAYTGSTPHPSARTRAAAAFDEARGVVVMFGGKSGVTVLDETWTWDGSAWAQAQPTTTPGGRSDAVLAYDRRRRRIVLFGGRDMDYPNQPSLNDVWEWDGTTWTAIAATSPPPLDRFGPGVTYDSTRSRLVLFGGDVNSIKPDTKVYELTVWADACTKDTDCATGFCTDGLCCRKASCNLCEACNVDPVQAGDCAPLPAGSADPRCDGGTCDAMGLCGP